VIDLKSLERDAGGKPVSNFLHPLLLPEPRVEPPPGADQRAGDDWSPLLVRQVRALGRLERRTLTESISGGGEVVSTFCGTEEVADVADDWPEGSDCPFCLGVQLGFELGEGYLDRVQVGL
jgi:hypothetical protein